MANDITIHFKNNVYLIVEPANFGISQELADYFSFYVDGYKWMPKYKSGMWDGKIKLFNMYNNTLYAGLKKYVYDFAKKHGYKILDKTTSLSEKLDPKYVAELYSQLNLHSDGGTITPRAHQYAGLYHALNKKRVTLLSPTASGKSLIIYGLVREFINRNKNVLIVVPTTNLVNQMYSDFDDYASETEWNSEDYIHKIYSGKDKNTKLPVTVSTWQSIYKMGKQYFKKFDMVIVDECHGLKASSLTGILEKSDCEYRIGMTGTLDDMQANILVIEGLLGPTKKLISTKELMDKGEIAKLKIECISFEYPDHDKKFISSGTKATYPEEIDFIIGHKERNIKLVNLIAEQKGNSLVLVNKIVHGELLQKLIKKKVGKRKVYLINGATSADDREILRGILEKEKESIAVATYGVFSTGISIKNLHNLFLAAPAKSKIRVLQSIGRSLRLHSTKKHATLFDISDNLSWKKRKNHTITHFLRRIELYSKEKFDYKLKSIKL